MQTKLSEQGSMDLASVDDKVVAASSLKTASPLVAKTSLVSITFSWAYFLQLRPEELVTTAPQAQLPSL